jgi:UDPglucose--hexose-1-phosphate uridylyltransferase
MSPTSTRGIHRSSHRLADGREIVYFDDREPYADGSVQREVHDTRPLGPAEQAGEMRLDPLTGEWVAMAAHRMNRTFMPPADECPLCPSGRGTVPSEVPSEDYDVVVFENRFPSFSASPPPTAGLVDDQPLWPVEPAAGRCEVICFSSDHATSFGHLTPHRVRTVVEAWADRTAELSANPAVRQVFPFENRGREIGVTLHHPHGQIYAYPYVTPRTTVMLRQAEAHRRSTGGSLLADVLAAERAAGTRVVLPGEHWTAYVPAAARWPVEVHLAPHRDVPDLAALDDAERDELSVVYLELMQRLDRFFPAPDGGELLLPYIAGWHQAPLDERRELGRLHLQVFSVLRAPGRLKYLAGSESGMGAWVNDTTPERIADRLREVGG